MRDPGDERSLHHRASEVFVQACRLSGEGRRAFVERACDGDEVLRHEVAELLAEDERACELDRPALGFAVPAAADLLAAAEARALPQTVGDYRILGLLGEGGMGVVYLAEQCLTRRAVALKVLRSDVVSPRALRRFELEAEVLGRLQHPGIAQIYEAGTVALGGRAQTFFAMELVEGTAITEYARRHGLSLCQRLELLARVCEAVHHAHQKGVVHRDLKPENILITFTAQPKVLDFGVARVREADVPRISRATACDQLVGTVSAMSPEQTLGAAGELDIRSDVYALGVVAFEVLTGRPPYDLAGLPLDAALRRIREVEPPRLGALDRRLRGDVEAIVARALEKDRERRYPSAADMAADIHRHLAGETITARPATTLVQLGKFARRRKRLVGALALLALSLASGAVVATALMLEARREADRAQRLSDVLVEVLTACDPSKHGPDVTVLEALDMAEPTLAARFGAHPDLEAEVRAVIGSLYLKLGRPEPAERNLTRALELFAAGPEARDPRALEAHLDLAALYLYHLKRYDEAGAILAATSARGAEVFERSPRLAVKLRLLEGKVARYRGDFARAESIGLAVTGLAEEAFGPDDPTTLRCQSDLARVLTEQCEFDAAERVAREALHGLLGTLGESHYLTAQVQVTLADLLMRRDLGDHDAARLVEAREVLAQALATRERMLGKDHLNTQLCRDMLAEIATMLGEDARPGESGVRP